MVSAFYVLSFLKSKFINFDCPGSSLLPTGFLQLQCPGFPFQWLLLLQGTGSRACGPQQWQCRAQQLQFLGSRAQTQWPWRMGLVAPWHVGVFLDQGSNLWLLHWHVDFSPLSHQGSLPPLFFDSKSWPNTKWKKKNTRQLCWANNISRNYLV